MWEDIDAALFASPSHFGYVGFLGRRPVSRGATPLLKLMPMSVFEFAAYQSRTVSDYASAILKTDGGDRKAAEKHAGEAFLTLLPQGRDTADHHFFTLIESTLSAVVGALWLGEATTEDRRWAFIYDLFIHPAYRGQGYGAGALEATQAWAGAMGMRHIDLHVFGHNTRAQRLYQTAGYQPTHIHMRKMLT